MPRPSYASATSDGALSYASSDAEGPLAERCTAKFRVRSDVCEKFQGAQNETRVPDALSFDSP